MRRFLRRAAMVLGVLVLLTVVAMIGTLTPVDDTHWARTEAAARAHEALQALEQRAEPLTVQGGLRAGFGRASLTPRVNQAPPNSEAGEFAELPLAGYGDREGKPATGVHDALWAKALAMAVNGRTGVVVSADALIIPREVAELAGEQVGRATGLGRDAVYFGATHTHSGPGGWGQGWVAEIFAGPFTPGAREWMASRLAAAVAAAVADLDAAEAGTAGFEAPEFTRNRLVGDAGRVRARFDLLRVRQRDGDEAVVGAYSAHATTLSGRMMEFSGDYPGVWQRVMEEQGGAAMAMFLAGAVGSHAPRAPSKGWAGTEAMGTALAERSIEALRGATLTNQAAFGLQTLWLALPDLQARLTGNLRLRSWAASRLLPVGEKAPIQALRLGDAIWLSTPCDFSGELALELEAQLEGAGRSVVVTSFNGDYVGYVTPSRYYSLNSYETRTMSFLGPQFPDLIMDALSRLARAMAE